MENPFWCYTTADCFLGVSRCLIACCCCLLALRVLAVEPHTQYLSLLSLKYIHIYILHPKKYTDLAPKPEGGLREEVGAIPTTRQGPQIGVGIYVLCLGSVCGCMYARLRERGYTCKNKHECVCVGVCDT
jgi:hypothetical protein